MPRRRRVGLGIESETADVVRLRHPRAATGGRNQSTSACSASRTIRGLHGRDRAWPAFGRCEPPARTVADGTGSIVGRKAVVASWLGEANSDEASTRDAPGTYAAQYGPVAVDGDVVGSDRHIQLSQPTRRPDRSHPSQLLRDALRCRRAMPRVHRVLHPATVTALAALQDRDSIPLTPNSGPPRSGVLKTPRPY